MKAIDMMNRLRDVEEQVDAARIRVDIYRSIAEKTSAPTGGEHVSKSRNVTAHEDAIIRLMKAEEEFDRVSLEYNQVIDDVTSLISLVKDRDQRMVAVDFFIKRECVADIARNRHLSERTTYRFYKEALATMDQYLTSS